MKYILLFLIAGLFASLIAVEASTSIVVPDATASRAKLNQMLSAQAVEAAIEKAWTEKQFVASPNVPAKCTSLSGPVNDQGQIIQVDVVTYYSGGVMRYATNKFSRRAR